MAVNKNFVIKNGVEVRTDLIVGDAANGRVGIATTTPRYTLHVNGGIGVTNLTVLGVSTFLTGPLLIGTGSSTGTANQFVQVAGDTYISGNLGIANTLPSSKLDIIGDAKISGVTTAAALVVSGISTITTLNATTANLTTGNIVTGVVTTLTGTNINYSGVGTFNALITTNLNTTGIGTVATLNATTANLTTANITTGNIVTGVVTTLRGTNINYSGVSTFSSVRISSGIVTASSGIVTYYGDGSQLQNIISGVGIQSAGNLVSYGATILNFIGAGNTFSFNPATKTMDISIQSGGKVGFATYVAGIATASSVGINTTNLDDPGLTGVGNSFKGLYISNGMIIVDNALNGNHYIGTDHNGLMAGPVTVNGTLTVDGNWVVV